MQFSLRIFVVVCSLVGLTLGLWLRPKRVHYTTVEELYGHRGEILRGADIVGKVRVVTAWLIPPKPASCTIRGNVDGKVYSISDKDLADRTYFHEVTLLEEFKTGKVSWLVVKMPEK